MNAEHDLDRALGAWFGAEAAPAPPPEPIERIVETTRHRRPLPSVVAGIGGHWVGSPPTRAGYRLGTRPVPVLAVVALIAILLAGVALLVGGRTPAPPLPVRHTYFNELIAASDLPTPMLRPVLVPLADGRVLIVGNGDDPTTRAYVFDPATGTSVGAGPMVSADSLFASSAVRLADGRVLIVGDVANEIFDPTTMRFADVGPGVTARSGAAAVLLQDGRVLIAGGSTLGDGAALRSAELFDPATSMFSMTGSLVAQTSGPLAMLPDGRAFMASGGIVEVYDPATGTFSATGTIPLGVGSQVQVVTDDGLVVLLGSTGLYDKAAAGTWDPTSRMVFAGRGLPQPVMGATLLDDGRILVTGGSGNSSWSGIYDPRTEMTVEIEATRAYRPTSTRLSDGRVLIVGGLVDRRLKGMPTVQIFQ
jgi:hypothetical protein